MCGIVGYIGPQIAEPILMDGLRRLEYRGYDSAGLAFIQDNQFQVVRAKGKLSELDKKLKDAHHTATIGIGHTRWATHGRPDETNAHPHHAKDVVLVHNGIIENYRELKEKLIQKNHEVVSETDTEIIAHLIQDHLNKGLKFKEAFLKSLSELEGAYALVVMDRNDPSRIYIARQGSPMVLGINDNEKFVASDIPALLAHTKDVVFLNDGECGILEADNFQIMTLAGEPVEKDVQTITWSLAQAEKGGYKHFMLKEIFEQPRVLADTLTGRIGKTDLKLKLAEAEGLIEDFAARDKAHLHIVACGTSWHAGLVAKYWIENLAKIPVNVELSSEFRYRQPLVNENSLVIAISQSGETADTLAAIRQSKEMGGKILSVCNVVESTIPRESDATLYTYAGPEIGVASTKAFTTQMAVLYMVAIKLAEARQTLSTNERQERLRDFLRIPSVMESMLKDVEKLKKQFTEKLYKHRDCYYLGRGIQFPIVLEGALKLKEISYIHAEAFAGGEIKHGPIALIEEGTPVIAVCLKNNLYEKMISNVEEIQARGAVVFGIVSDDETHTNAFEETYTIPTIHPDLNAFLTVLPLQLISYYVADRRGTDVDQPRNLAKSVTVE